MGTADTAANFGDVIAKQAANLTSAAYMAGEQLDDIRGLLANEMAKTLAGDQEFVPVVMLGTGQERLQKGFDAIADTLGHMGTDRALMAVLAYSKCPLVTILRERITAAYVDMCAEDVFNARRGA